MYMPHRGGAETRIPQPEVIEWDSLDETKKNDYLDKATVSGSGALTRLVFNTKEEIEAIRNSNLFDKSEKSLIPDSSESFIIQTLAFRSHLDEYSLPSDFIRLHVMRLGQEYREYSIVGTVPAEEFKATFKQLFP